MRKKVRVAAHHSQPHNAYSPDAAFYQARGLRDLKRALKAPRFEGRAKNVIFFVGDGLGVATHTMSRIYKGQKKGTSGEEESLVWEDWDYSGLIKVCLFKHKVIVSHLLALVSCEENISLSSAPNVANCVSKGQGIVSFNHLKTCQNTFVTYFLF